MGKRILVACIFISTLLGIAAPVSAQEAGIVYLQQKEETKRVEGEVTKRIAFRLSNERVEYHLMYDCLVTPDMPEGRCRSKQWVFTIGMVTLGMTNPSQNWYGQGFFNVLLDGEGIHDYRAKFTALRVGGPEAMVEGIWDTPKARVTCQFMLRDGDDKLLVQFEIHPKTTLKAIQLKLLCYPNGFYGDKDRWLSTSTRNVRHDETVQLDTPREYWVLYYDNLLSGDKVVGPCALLYVPEETQSASVEVTSYPIWTVLNYPPNTKTFHIALYDFAGWPNVSENLSYLKHNGPSFLRDLKERAKDWLTIGKTVVLPEPRESAFRKLVSEDMAPTPYERMTQDIVTPHIKWAKPYAGRKPKVLVLAPRWGQRETVELAQRFDIDYDTVSFSDVGTVFEARELNLYEIYCDVYGLPMRSVTWVLKKLRRKLQNEEYDCMIIAGVRTKILPGFFCDLIREKVANGMGLIVTGPNSDFEKSFDRPLSGDQAFCARGVPLSVLPVGADYSLNDPDKQPLATCYDHGRGRVLFFKYPISSRELFLTPAPSSEAYFEPVYYDYYMALIAKAIIWASGIKTPAALLDVGPSARRVVIDCHEEMPEAQLRVAIRDAANFVEDQRDVSLKLHRATNELPIAMPRLKPGDHFVDVWLVRRGKTLDWFTAPFTTESDSAIAALSVSSSKAKTGYSVKAAAKLRGTKPGLKLDIELKDNLGRLLGEKNLTTSAGLDYTVAFDLPCPVTMLHFVAATLTDGQGLVDRKREILVIPDRNRDDYSFIAWSSGSGSMVRRAINTVMYEHDVDAIDNVGMTGGDAVLGALRGRYAAEANLRSIPYITRIASKQETGLVRKPCLTDPTHLSQWTDGLRQRATGISPYGCLGYTLGDENFLVNRNLDLCFSPTCMADFRKWLRGVYGTLEALNKEWDTKFASWDEVEPITLDEALEQNQLARWCDHRMHMESVFAQAHALGGKSIREIDPDARVGFDGLFSTTSFRGYDFHKLCRASEVLQVYQRKLVQFECLRSFTKEGSLIGGWCNRIAHEDEISARRVPWHILLNGGNSVWFWTSYNVGESLLRPDLRPAPILLWMEQECREIKAGIGKLLMHCERLNDGIAIHYSQASIHAGTIVDRDLDKSQLGMMELVEDLGLQYDFVAYADIEQDKLKRDNYRALFMPLSLAVSEAEVNAVRRFVQDGGILIADIRPGVMDGHCKPLAKASLDDVFGVAQTPFSIQTEKELSEPSEEQHVLKLSQEMGGGELAVRAHDPRLRLTTGKALASQDPEVPAVVLNSCGKGKAVLLNFDIAEYDDLRTDVQETSVRELVRAVLKECGLEPRIRIKVQEPLLGRALKALSKRRGAEPSGTTAESDRNLNACETVFFKAGDIEYVAIVKEDNINDKDVRPAEIIFPRQAFVYDVRGGRRFGKTDRVRTPITPGVPKLYALLPYDGVSLAATLAQKEVAPGGRVDYKLDVSPANGRIAGTHAVRLSVFDPNGHELEHYARNILVKQSPASGSLYLAFNDPTGKWRLVFREIATGATSEVTFNVITK